jgi:hypothetical protein
MAPRRRTRYAGTMAGLPAWKYATVTPYANYTYLLTAQIMAGYKPHEIRAFAQAAIAEGLAAPFGATTTVGTFVDNGWIRIYDQIREMISVLQDNGFDVWIVTASPQRSDWAASPHVCRSAIADYLSRSPYVVSRDRQNLNLAMRRAMAMSMFAHWRPARAPPTMPRRMAPPLAAR